MGVVCLILESMALIEVSLEELPVSAIFGSVLPSNNDRSTRAQLIWVVLPQLVSELADSLPEMATLVFQQQTLKLDFKTTKVFENV